MHMTVRGSMEGGAVPFIRLNLIPVPGIGLLEKPENSGLLNECSSPCSQQLSTEICPELYGINGNLPKEFLHNPL